MRRTTPVVCRERGAWSGHFDIEINYVAAL
jgi:hypothetical protein